MKNQKSFTIRIGLQTQKEMQELKKIQGINWGFVIRDAIERRLKEQEAIKK
jgi:predicted DNA-binding protein